MKIVFLALTALTLLAGCGDPIKEATEKALAESAARQLAKVEKQRAFVASPEGIEHARVQDFKRLLQNLIDPRKDITNICQHFIDDTIENRKRLDRELAQAKDAERSIVEMFNTVGQIKSAEQTGNKVAYKKAEEEFSQAFSSGFNQKMLKKRMKKSDQRLLDMKAYCPAKVTAIQEGRKNVACAKAGKHPSCWRT